MLTPEPGTGGCGAHGSVRGTVWRGIIYLPPPTSRPWGHRVLLFPNFCSPVASFVTSHAHSSINRGSPSFPLAPSRDIRQDSMVWMLSVHPEVHGPGA